MYNTLLQHTVRTKLIYCDTKTLGASTGAVHHAFQINNIFDPDATGVGHQPAFYDKWSALYSMYRVLGCKWTITFAPDRIEQFNLVAATYPYSDSSAHDQRQLPSILTWEAKKNTSPEYTQAADLNVIRETGSRDPQFSYRMTSGKADAKYVMKGYANIKRLLDTPDEYETATSFGFNPLTGAYLLIGKLSKDGGTSAAYRFDIRLEYFVELTNGTPENQN